MGQSFSWNRRLRLFEICDQAIEAVSERRSSPHLSSSLQLPSPWHLQFSSAVYQVSWQSRGVPVGKHRERGLLTIQNVAENFRARSLAAYAILQLPRLVA